MCRECDFFVSVSEWWWSQVVNMVRWWHQRVSCGNFLRWKRYDILRDTVENHPLSRTQLIPLNICVRLHLIPSVLRRHRLLFRVHFIYLTGESSTDTYRLELHISGLAELGRGWACGGAATLRVIQSRLHIRNRPGPGCSAGWGSQRSVSLSDPDRRRRAARGCSKGCRS